MRDIHKTEKRIVLTLKFLVMDKRKNIQSVPKSTFKMFVDLSLMGKEGKRHFFFIKDFNTFLYDHTLLPGRKHFYCYFLQAFSTTEIFKNHVNCFCTRK